MYPQRVESLSHAQHERLAYIDFRLYFLGKLGRPDLIDRFGVAPAGAPRALALYPRNAPPKTAFARRPTGGPTGKAPPPPFEPPPPRAPPPPAPPPPRGGAPAGCGGRPAGGGGGVFFPPPGRPGGGREPPARGRPGRPRRGGGAGAQAGRGARRS